MNNNDRIIRATAGDGYIKMAVITAKDTVQRWGVCCARRR